MKLVILGIAVILSLQGCIRSQPLSCKAFNAKYSKDQCIKDRKTVDSLTVLEQRGGS